MSTAPNLDQLGKALSHPLRVKILKLLAASPAPLSPADMSRTLDEPIGNVSYHVRFLLDDGGAKPRGWTAIDLVDTRQRRGAIEHFYRLRPEWATSLRPFLDAERERSIDQRVGRASGVAA